MKRKILSIESVKYSWQILLKWETARVVYNSILLLWAYYLSEELIQKPSLSYFIVRLLLLNVAYLAAPIVEIVAFIGLSERLSPVRRVVMFTLGLITAILIMRSGFGDD